MWGFVCRVGFFLGLCGAVWTASATGAERIPVFVSIVPQKYFVEKIGGNLLDVSVMVLPGASPHTYEPKPQQMVALSKAKIYFATGVSFENVWLKRFRGANPDMIIVHTEAGIEKIPMKAHFHDEGGKPEHEETEEKGVRDPHIWLSPPLVMLQARNILQALFNVDAVHRSLYAANYRQFILELLDLDAELMETFAGKGKGMKFMVFHPAWGYFARAYGLEQVPVEIEGKEPKPQELQDLIRFAKERGIKTVFVQPQFSTKSAEVIANSIGGQVAYTDPLAQDWANNLREVAAKFEAALK